MKFNFTNFLKAAGLALAVSAVVFGTRSEEIVRDTMDDKEIVQS